MIMKKNILVVDDSALMRRVICDIINSDDTFQVTDVCRTEHFIDRIFIVRFFFKDHDTIA